MLPFIFTLLLSTTYVAAHGFVHQVIIDGQSYLGNPPNADPNPSIVRQISAVDPVKGADNLNINCGQNAQLAALVANAMPGSSISFDWRGGDLSKVSCRSESIFFVRVVRLFLYMFLLPDATCSFLANSITPW